ncbi:hypothetical protein [Oceanobacillus alkalisoli]|uniref:hypothetical protein n=1 Tax=Oceanobacillus alkalisoli TaxID=2925113 RepID=UPI001EEFBE4A|nr:hypothetical protein [Oceanobacillus alkalisoli]MCG5105003.1 hypothetical protein [Oceanobacillus alkalisoli]
MNKKWIISLTIFIIFLFGGGITATVADSSLSGIITSWFDVKTERSIVELDNAIKEEQAIQTERLKEVLAEQIAEVDQEWDEFVEVEKQRQLTILREHTDTQIAELNEIREIDPERKKVMENELERIFQEAATEMEEIKLEIVREEVE